MCMPYQPYCVAYVAAAATPFGDVISHKHIFKLLQFFMI